MPHSDKDLCKGHFTSLRKAQDKLNKWTMKQSCAVSVVLNHEDQTPVKFKTFWQFTWTQTRSNTDTDSLFLSFTLLLGSDYKNNRNTWYSITRRKTHIPYFQPTKLWFSVEGFEERLNGPGQIFSFSEEQELACKLASNFRNYKITLCKSSCFNQLELICIVLILSILFQDILY